MLSQRLQGAFPSDTEKNPRAQANAVTLRSGTKYDGPKLKEPEIEVDVEEVVRKDKNIVEEVDHEDEIEYERKKKEDEAMKRRMEEHARNEPLPFPGRLKKQNEDKNYKKFLEMFRGLDIRQNSFRLTDQNSKWYESTELSNPQGRVLNTKVFALTYSSQIQRKWSFI